MMRPGLLAWVVLVGIVGMILMSTYEKHTGSSWAGVTEETTWEYLIDMKNVTFQQESTGDWSFVMFNAEYFKTWAQVLTFDFGFFEGDMEIIRWILFIPVAAAFVYLLVYGFVQLLQGFIPFT